jgi:signal transduction histidine kinase
MSETTARNEQREPGGGASNRGRPDITLPSSRVQEVEEVNAAFESMSAGLRRSLEQQAALEQERRFFIGAVLHDLRPPQTAIP